MKMEKLNLLVEKVVQPNLRPNYFAYCPTMDLIASATVDEQVNVHRLNGQRVFGISSKSGMGKISGLRWKPDGRLLSMGKTCADKLQARSLPWLIAIMFYI